MLWTKLCSRKLRCGSCGVGRVHEGGIVVQRGIDAAGVQEHPRATDLDLTTGEEEPIPAEPTT